MALEEVYFWTSTVKDWKLALKPDKYKRLILNCWKELVEKKLIRIYGYVIMPNHLHVVWEMLKRNGKEMPSASFNKATSHLFFLDLKKHHPLVLPFFRVQEKERQYRLWQRDSLAVLLDSKQKVEQKLEYMHTNPLQERWNLSDRPENYLWSSAGFYLGSKDGLGILTHYADRF